MADRVSGFTGKLVPLGYTVLYWAVLGCTGPYWALLGLTGTYWALLGLTGSYWDLLGLTRMPYLALLDLTRPNFAFAH